MTHPAYVLDVLDAVAVVVGLLDQQKAEADSAEHECAPDDIVRIVHRVRTTWSEDVCRVCLKVQESETGDA